MGKSHTWHRLLEAVKDLMRNYEKCPQNPDNITIHPRYLAAIRAELIRLDSEMDKAKRTQKGRKR